MGLRCAGDRMSHLFFFLGGCGEGVIEDVLYHSRSSPWV